MSAAPVSERQTLDAEIKHVEGQLRTATAWRRARLLDQHRQLRARLCALKEWGDVETVAREHAGRGERPTTDHYLAAATQVCGTRNDLEWPADIRAELIDRGCELLCVPCRGEGGVCTCGEPLCCCPKCDACDGTGIEVRP